MNEKHLTLQERWEMDEMPKITPPKEEKEEEKEEAAGNGIKV